MASLICSCSVNCLYYYDFMRKIIKNAKVTLIGSQICTERLCKDSPDFLNDIYTNSFLATFSMSAYLTPLLFSQIVIPSKFNPRTVLNIFVLNACFSTNWQKTINIYI